MSTALNGSSEVCCLPPGLAVYYIISCIITALIGDITLDKNIMTLWPLQNEQMAWPQVQGSKWATCSGIQIMIYDSVLAPKQKIKIKNGHRCVQCPQQNEGLFTMWHLMVLVVCTTSVPGLNLRTKLAFLWSGSNKTRHPFPRAYFLPHALWHVAEWRRTVVSQLLSAGTFQISVQFLQLLSFL